ncbi:MAG: aspartate aminotransferase family protein [Flavobacteriia bacterium]|nr:aspartate aminotransferase family protein [Flavobacteriia bacterium]
MMWVKKSQQEIRSHIFDALSKNVNYQNQSIIGLPASYLDEKVFNQDKFNLNEAPFLSTLLQNPNHIGCHTLGCSESYFIGTQAIEREVVQICANDILKGNDETFDGYIASGGTEANIQALWIYRNYFQRECQAKNDEIAIICSMDSHYSMAKGANLLGLVIYKIDVNEETRILSEKLILEKVQTAKEEGKKYFIVVANMMTTMFGSVDETKKYSDILKSESVNYKIHIDGAFGGFYYPFSNALETDLNFLNPEITSVTLDAHKMAQAPYGTGIFVIRKGFMQYATTEEASYVEGEDCTLIGSRSGANAIAIWMILSTYGPHGWNEKVLILQKRTDLICEKLNELNVEYFRNSYSNIVTIKSKYVSMDIVYKFGLVPDNHHDPKWYKIVVMEHVTMEKINPFLSSLEESLSSKIKIVS